MSVRDNRVGGTLRVILLSAHGLPTIPESCSVTVGHGDNSGTTHSIPKAGGDPLFNSTFSFPYEHGAAVDFDVMDQKTEEIICTGARHTSDIADDKPWSGHVHLTPKGFVLVRIEFSHAPIDPPTRAAIAIRKGKDFYDVTFKEAAVLVALSKDVSDRTEVVACDETGTFCWNKLFQFEYGNQQQLIIDLIDSKGRLAAEGQFDLWTMEPQGRLKRTIGDLPITDLENRIIGKIGINITLWYNEDYTDGPPEIYDLDTPREVANKGVDGNDETSQLLVGAKDVIDPESALEQIMAAKNIALSAVECASKAVEIRPTYRPKQSAATCAAATAEIDQFIQNAKKRSKIHLLRYVKEAKSRQFYAEHTAKEAIETVAQDLVEECQRIANKAEKAEIEVKNVVQDCQEEDVLAEEVRCSSAASSARKLAQESSDTFQELRATPNITLKSQSLILIKNAVDAAIDEKSIARDAARNAASLARRHRRKEERRRQKLEEREKRLQERNERLKEGAATDRQSVQKIDSNEEDDKESSSEDSHKPEEDTSRKREDDTSRKREDDTSRKREDDTSRKREDDTSRKREDDTSRKREQDASRKREEDTSRKREEDTSRKREENAASRKQEDDTSRKPEEDTGRKPKDSRKPCHAVSLTVPGKRNYSENSNDQGDFTYEKPQINARSHTVVGTRKTRFKPETSSSTADHLPPACSYVANASKSDLSRHQDSGCSFTDSRMMDDPDMSFEANDRNARSMVVPTSYSAKRNRYPPAYIPPPSEIDILIEGEGKSPLCCCGLRWRSYN